MPEKSLGGGTDSAQKSDKNKNKYYSPPPYTVSKSPEKLDDTMLTTTLLAEDFDKVLNRRSFIATASLAVIGGGLAYNFFEDWKWHNHKQEAGDVLGGKKIDPQMNLEDGGIPTTQAVKQYVNQVINNVKPTSVPTTPVSRAARDVTTAQTFSFTASNVQEALEKLDSALRSAVNDIGTKASQTSVNTLSAQLSNKVDNTDPRLTDPRTPLSHNHPLSQITQSGAVSGQVAQWNGSTWIPASVSGTGTVTNVTTGTGLSGGSITSSGTIALANTTVTPGTYGGATQSANITIDAQGRITSASNTTIAPTAGSITGAGNLTTPTTGVTVTGGSGAVLGNVSVAIQNATTSQPGLLTSGDWNTFNNKQGALTLTNTGTSGAATLVGTTLNIPNYTTGSSGTVTSVGLNAPAAGITVAGSPVTTSGAFTLALADDLAAVEALATTGLVRRTAANTWNAGGGVNLGTEVTGTLPAVNGGTGLTTIGGALQLLRVNTGATALEYFTPTYLTANQTITLTGDVTGSGTTAITTTIAAGSVTLAKLASNSVDSTKIVDGSITGTDIANQTVTGDKIAQMTAVVGQVLKWDGTQWSPASDNVGGAGTLNDPGANGVLVRTSLGNTVGRTLTGSGTITINNPDGTAGNPIFAVNQSGLNLSLIGGTLNLSTQATGVLPVVNGGTGSSTQAGARTNLGAAASGVNNDITQLTGLAVPLSITQGGTGATTAAGARTNIGADNASNLSSGTVPATVFPALTGDVTTPGGSYITTITNAAVTLAKLASNSVDSSKIVDGSIATADIANSNVTLAKIQNIPNNTLLGNNTGSSAAPVALTPVQAKALLAIAAGDVSGLALIATSGSASDLTTGTVPVAQLTNAQLLSEKNQNNGYPGLDAAGKINPSQLPAIAITNTYVVNSQPAMLALSANQGDIAVRTDTNETFILQMVPPTNVLNWVQLLFPTSPVSSFNGRTGVVTSQAGDYTATQITNTPAGNISSTTVQAALNELDSEKQPLDAGLTSISGLTGAGYVRATGTDTYTHVSTINLTSEVSGQLAIANGGTGANTQAGARTNLGAAASGANSDITSITGLTTALQINQGGTGSITQNFVDLTTAQTIAGNKTFSNPISISTTGAQTAAVFNLTNAAGSVAQFVTNGSPEGAVAAPVGSLAIDSTTGSVYTKTGGGITNTGWTQLAAAGGGVTSVGAVNGGSTANAATISGTVLNLSPADSTNPGILTAGSQNIGGAKTFTGAGTALTVTNNTSLGGNLTVGGTTNLNGAVNVTTSSGLGLLAYGVGAGNTTQLRLYELGNINFVGLRAPDSLTTDNIYTFPNGYGSTGQVLTTDGSGSLSWTSAGGGVTSVGTVNGSSTANAATITGTVLNLSPADATNPGVVTTGIQTFGGSKTFQNTLTAAGSGIGLSVTNNATVGGSLTVSSMSTAGIVKNNAAGLLSGGNLITNTDITNASIDLTTKVTGVLPATNGGTGTGTTTVGDILIGAAANTWSPLAIGTNGQVLTVNGGGTATWATPSSSTPLNNVINATGSATRDHTNNTIQWDWSTAAAAVNPMTWTANSLTTGNLFTLSSTNTALTGTLLNVTSASTGAFSNGGVRFNFTGAHTGSGVQIDSVTQAGAALRVNANATTTGYGLRVSSSSALTAGNTVYFENSSLTAQRSTLNVLTNSTSIPVNFGGVNFTMNGAHTGVGLRLADFTLAGTAQQIELPAITTGTGLLVNDANGTLTTGALLTLTTTAGATYTGTGGVFRLNASSMLTGTAANINVNSMTSGLGFSITSTGTAATGNLFLVSSGSTGAFSNGGVRYNFTGAHTGNGVQVDSATLTGNAERINANSLTSGNGLSIASTGTALTSGALLQVTASGNNASATGSLASITNTNSSSLVGTLNVNNSSTSAHVATLTGQGAVRLLPFGTTATSTTELRFYESDTGGTPNQYVGFRAPHTVTTTVTWQLPPADGTAGQVLSTNGAGILSWATASGGSTPLNLVQDATGSATRAHGANNIAWNWDTLSTGAGLAFGSASTSLTGDLVSVTSSGSAAGVTGNALKVGMTGASAIGTTLNVTHAGPSGYVARFNADGTYTDTTNPVVIDFSGRVGIGTQTVDTTFQPALQISDDTNGGKSDIFISNYNVGTGYGALIFAKAGGTRAAPTTTSASQTIGGIRADSRTTTASWNRGVDIILRTTSSYTGNLDRSTAIDFNLIRTGATAQRTIATMTGANVTIFGTAVGTAPIAPNMSTEHSLILAYANDLDLEGSSILFRGTTTSNTHGVIGGYRTSGGGGGLVFSTSPSGIGYTDRIVINNQGLIGLNTVSPAARLDNAGNLALRLGTDSSVTGTQNNINLALFSTIRLTNTSALTITGIANGVNGYRLTLINAGTSTVTLTNNDAGSTAANRITTGTGGSVSIPQGAALSLVYDSTASLWRTTGNWATGGGGSALSALTAAVGPNTFDNAANAQTWTWNTLGGSTALNVSTSHTTFTGDLARFESIGNAAGVTGSVLKAGVTGATSNAVALNVTNGGTGLTARFNNDGTYADTTTSVVIDATGRVGIGTIAPNVVLDVVGTLALRRGTDYSTVGSTNDVALGSASLVRLSGATAQTLTGITGGVDGRILTLMNVGTAPAVLANASGSSAAANQIITGTGANLSLPVGAAVTLVYDAGASLWRVNNGGVTGGGGSAALSAITAGVAPNTIDSTSNAQTWNWSTLGANTALTLGTADAAFTGNVLNINSSGNNAAVTGSALRVDVAGATSAATGLFVTNAGNGFTARFNIAIPTVVTRAGRLLVGTTNEANALAGVAGIYQVVDNDSNRVNVMTTTYSASTYSCFVARRAYGTEASPVSVPVNTATGSVDFAGYSSVGGPGFYGFAEIAGYTSPTWGTVTDKSGYIQFDVTPTGAITRRTSLVVYGDKVSLYSMAATSAGANPNISARVAQTIWYNSPNTPLAREGAMIEFSSWLASGLQGGLSGYTDNSLTGGGLGFWTSNTGSAHIIRGVIDKNGNWGIGTLAPTSRLEVSSGTAGVTGITLTNVNSSTTGSAGLPLGVNASGVVNVLNTITTNQGLSLGSYAASTGSGTELRFISANQSSTNYVGFKAPDTIAANRIWILPAADATVSGQALTSNAAGILSWSTVSSTLNTIASATGTGTTNNGANAITWNWTGLGIADAFTYTGTGVTSGSVVRITSDNTSATSGGGALEVTTSNGGAGYAANFIANGLTSTTGKALGVSTTTGGVALEVGGGGIAIQSGGNVSAGGGYSDFNTYNHSNIRITAPSVATFTGVQFGTNGKLLTFHNMSGVSHLFNHLNIASAGQNRFFINTGITFTLHPYQTVTWIYDSSVNYWLLWSYSDASYRAVKSISANYTVTLQDDAMLVSAAAVTFTLPLIDNTNDGKVLTFLYRTNSYTLNRSGTNLIYNGGAGATSVSPSITRSYIASNGDWYAL